ncbi:mast cell-expressed membrane protein 1 [Acomys russatus]|uniref:mast cell-expressed membrane protein 1 n=1 Tax=Acomys russatus TaxID=60746 RepID=UPI0021E2510B|nr:mast cell-expressed membrane protein 1 [Acomys russatus]
MQALASQDKNWRKPVHNEGDHNPDYENITLGFRNKDQLKHSQPAPTKQAAFKASQDTAHVPAWLHRTIMVLYVLLALIFSSCIVLSALVLVKNSEMSRELWSLNEALSNVSSTALKCQDQQMRYWKDLQKVMQEVKSSTGMVLSNVLNGNNRLKTVPEDITQIKKTLEALEKRTQARKPGAVWWSGVESQIWCRSA